MSLYDIHPVWLFLSSHCICGPTIDAISYATFPFLSTHALYFIFSIDLHTSSHYIHSSHPFLSRYSFYPFSSYSLLTLLLFSSLILPLQLSSHPSIPPNRLIFLPTTKFQIVYITRSSFNLTWLLFLASHPPSHPSCTCTIGDAANNEAQDLMKLFKDDKDNLLRPLAKMLSGRLWVLLLLFLLHWPLLLIYVSYPSISSSSFPLTSLFFLP